MSIHNGTMRICIGPHMTIPGIEYTLSRETGLICEEYGGKKLRVLQTALH